MSKINIEKIFEDLDIYFYYISSSSKTIFLSSSKEKTNAKELALEKLKPNIKSLIGKNIILVKIKNVEKKYNNDSNQLYGGPIAFEIENEIISSENKIKSGDKSKRTVFLSEKFIKKNIDNITIKLKNVVNDYKNNNLNCQQGILCMSIL
jgi:hypothetical protein